MPDLVLDEQATAWELRSAWLARRRVRLTLTERCVIQTIVGKVNRVSVTGATAEVDGWDVPVAEIRGVGKPTVADVDAYARVMHDLREQAGCEFCQGKRVHNAQTWLDGRPRPPAACPRCGRTA